MPRSFNAINTWANEAAYVSISMRESFTKTEPTAASLKCRLFRLAVP